MTRLLLSIKEDILATYIPELTIDDLCYIRTYQSLKFNSWSQLRASKELGVSVRTIRNYIKAMRNIGIEIPNSRGTINGRFKETQIKDS